MLVICVAKWFYLFLFVLTRSFLFYFLFNILFLIVVIYDTSYMQNIYIYRIYIYIHLYTYIEYTHIQNIYIQKYRRYEKQARKLHPQHFLDKKYQQSSLANIQSESLQSFPKPSQVIQDMDTYADLSLYTYCQQYHRISFCSICHVESVHKSKIQETVL